MILVASENFISFTNNKVENIIFCFKLFDFCVLVHREPWFCHALMCGYEFMIISIVDGYGWLFPFKDALPALLGNNQITRALSHQYIPCRECIRGGRPLDDFGLMYLFPSFAR